MGHFNKVREEHVHIIYPIRVRGGSLSLSLSLSLYIYIERERESWLTSVPWQFFQHPSSTPTPHSRLFLYPSQGWGWGCSGFGPNSNPGALSSNTHTKLVYTHILYNTWVCKMGLPSHVVFKKVSLVISRVSSALPDLVLFVFSISIE